MASGTSIAPSVTLTEKHVCWLTFTFIDSPFFSKETDLYEHYNIIRKINCQNKNATLKMQLFCKEMIKVPFNRYYALEIKNEKKLPQFFKTYDNNDY